MLIPPEAKDQPHVLPDPLQPTWSRQSDSSSSLASPTFVKPRYPSSRSVSRATTVADDVDHLPIAAQFSTIPLVTTVQDLEAAKNAQKQHPSNGHDSPPRKQGAAHEDDRDADATIRIKRTYHYLSKGQPPRTEGGEVNDPRHARRSLPPPRRPSMGFGSAQFDAPYGQNNTRLPSSKPSRISLNGPVPATSPTRHSRISSTIRKRISSVTSSSDTEQSNVVVPEDLRTVLQVIGNSILKGHLALSDALRKRYDEQYPLVRSLADIFIEHVSARFAMLSSVDQILMPVRATVIPISRVYRVYRASGEGSTATRRLPQLSNSTQKETQQRISSRRGCRGRDAASKHLLSNLNRVLI
jgi:hypothetical protein